MATSPDFLRLASNAMRALADTALDSLRAAVLVVDARHKLLPVVLANTAARHCLSQPDPAALIEAPLTRYLGSSSAAQIDPDSRLSFGHAGALKSRLDLAIQRGRKVCTHRIQALNLRPRSASGDADLYAADASTGLGNCR